MLALLGVWPLVWTRDFDGEARLRVARFTPFGEWTCKAIYGSMILLPNGTASRCSYVTDWCEWKHNRKHVDFSKRINIKKAGK